MEANVEKLQARLEKATQVFNEQKNEIESLNNERAKLLNELTELKGQMEGLRMECAKLQNLLDEVNKHKVSSDNTEKIVVDTKPQDTRTTQSIFTPVRGTITI